ncbi:MAG TPA: isoprenylcysteine carboxylmethyltransferase family protein [Candidatus Kapabacteria bacterium]|nr:isoprenylcysteine carboxylmethyltransferase family protein [Candidatus Kapabacteria bacterium]
MDIRYFLFRYRSYAPLPMLCVALWVAAPTAGSLACGIALALLGEMMRLWGVGYAGPETRTVDAPGGNRLITTGAFAYVRNPIYFGNMLLYVGIAIMSNVWWVPIVGYSYFQLQYALIISAEEEYLTKTYGDEYFVYRKNVRRYIPRLTAYRTNSPIFRQFDLMSGLRSEIRTFQAITVATLIMSAIAIWKS